MTKEYYNRYMKTKIQRMTKSQLTSEILRFESYLENPQKVRNTEKWLLGSYVIHLGLLKDELNKRGK